MSPRSAKQFELIRQKSRQKILDAALELFATRGFHNTSISQIAQKAGVAKGLIYNYFDKKEALMHALVHEAAAEGIDLMEQLGRINDPREQMRLILNISFDYMLKDPKHTKLMIALGLQIDHFPDLKEFIVARYTGTIPLFTQLLANLGIADPEAEAREITAMIDGIAVQYVLLGDALHLEELRKHLLKKYCAS